MDERFGAPMDTRSAAVDDELELFRLAAASEGTVRDRRHQQLVLRHLGLAESIALRYRRTQGDGRDLRQVAVVGLIKAVKRFDPDRGFTFAAFAAPTISGEIKRFLRDSTWMVRPPRGVLEIAVTVLAAMPNLQQELQREPTAADLAAHLDVPIDKVAEGLRGGQAMYSLSLDDMEEADIASYSSLVAFDPAQLVESRLELTRALATLTERQRRIVHLRFSEGLAQREIADELGVTQMQVSRLIAGILMHLRRVMEADVQNTEARTESKLA